MARSNSRGNGRISSNSRNKRNVTTKQSAVVNDNISLVKPQRDVVTEYLEEAYSKPLIKIKNEHQTEDIKLADIIKPAEPIVDTGIVIKDNIIVDDSDKTKLDDLIKILSTEVTPDPSPPKVIRVFGYSDEEAERIFKEEEKRRLIEAERKLDYERAITDENVRHSLFLEKIELMQLEFNIHLQKTYPWFVAERTIKTIDIDRKVEEVEKRKKENKAQQIIIQKLKIERLANEKKRKQKELGLQLNKLDENEIQSFFEEDILIEHRVKHAENEELDGLTKVERSIKEMKEMELRLGRPIIPHRDIVESDESDFDVNSITTSDDILIRPSNRIELANDDIKKELIFTDLRERLNANNTESDYILLKESGVSVRELEMMKVQLTSDEVQLQLMERAGVSMDRLS